MSSFPTSIDDFDTSMTAGGPMATPSHAAQHVKIGDALEKMQTSLAAGQFADYTLKNPASAGETSLVLRRPMPALGASYAMILVGVGLATAELVYVVPTGSATLNLSSSTSLRRPHVADEKLVVLTDELCPLWYGAKGDGATNDWVALMRCHIDSQAVQLPINGQGRDYAISQPLTFASSKIKQLLISSSGSYAPIVSPSTSSYTRNAMMPICQDYLPFSAAGGSTTISIPGARAGALSFAAANGFVYIFNNPDGASFPSGITEGVPYYVKTGDDTAKTITVSATPGGAAITVGAGSGYSAGGIFQLSRAYWDDIRCNINSNNVSGVMLNNQQDGYVKKMRIGMANITGSIGALIGGQWNVLNKFQADDPGAGSYGIYLTGTGHSIDEIVAEGVGTHIGCYANFVSIGHFWMEDDSATAVGLKIEGSTRGLKVGHIYCAGMSKILKVETTDASFEIDMIHYGGAAGVIDYNGALLYVGTNATAEGDNQGILKGLRKAIGSDSFFELDNRISLTKTSAYTMRLSDRVVFADPAGGTFAVTAPWAGWSRMPWTVKNIHASNSCTIIAVAGETFDDAAGPVTVAAGTSKTYVSDGTNHRSI